MDYKQLQDFIKELANSGAAEVEVETKDLKIKVKTQIKEKGKNTHIQLSAPYPSVPQITNPQQYIQQPQQMSANKEEVKQDEPKKSENIVHIKSPMVGTFYRKPAPDKADFVNIGDDIRVGQVVCIIEAMKLFNEIESEISGKLVEILVDDATPVEFDQPLFAIEIK